MMKSLDSIDIEDLPYIEKDLCFYELASLSLLLYGDNKSGSEYILQRLIILAQHPCQDSGPFATSDILRNYARLNPQTWRQHLVEALAIIRAKKVIRKLGLSWRNIQLELLPHVTELSVYIHPLLKALYKICERLPPDQACRLISYVHEKHSICQGLRFYDSFYLEIFLLNWLTKGVIACGDKQLEDCNVEILIEYFKFIGMDSMKDVLLETINLKLKVKEENIEFNSNETYDVMDSGIECEAIVEVSEDFDDSERYKITKENAGYILIINQSRFYYETNPELQHLLPERGTLKLTREGTDVDRDTLKKVFSAYGYKPLVFNNLTHEEILQQIRETVKKSKDKDSIIICILTHGKEGAVYGCNFIPVSIAEIREILTDKTLIGKPSMAFIQACQKHDPKNDTTGTSAMKNFHPDGHADQLWAISAVRGTESLRDTVSGSWFVQELCRAIQKYDKRKHILDILTVVTNNISKKRAGEHFMLSESNTTLRKDLYLPVS